MVKAEFKGFCPYEIGDKVEVKYHCYKSIIKDIRTIHYLAAMKTEFEFAMEDSPNNWVPESLILRRIE